MAHFNFVISQNAKWGHAGFYIDCHRMTVPENILLQKKHWSLRINSAVCYNNPYHLRALYRSCVRLQQCGRVQRVLARSASAAYQ